MSPGQLGCIVATIRDWAARYRIGFRPKAVCEMEQLGLDREDVRDVLLDLRTQDFHRRVRSVISGEWLYEFKSDIVGLLLYYKVAMRDECVLISFHEDEDDDEQDG